jgi:hypothetical protein
VLAPPQGFKQGIAKTHGKQVLHRWLAQVVVDAEDLLLFEDLAHGFVDGPVGGQVVAQWLFQHDAGLGRVQAVGGELFAHGGEQAGGGGQVHHHGVGLALGQARRQRGVGLWLGQVHAHVAQQAGKAVELFGFGALVALDLLKARLDLLAVLFVAQLVAAHADDAASFGQGIVAKGLEQGGHEFAPDQVAGAPKEDQIKSHVVLELHEISVCNVTLFQR